MSNKYPKLNITDEALTKLDIPKFIESNQNLRAAVINTNAHFDDIYNQIKETNREKYQREVESHEALLKIADNTHGINDLVSLVRQGNEINQQTFDLLQEMQTIMTAQNQEEAESIFRKVLDKANQTKEGIETIQSLIGYGKMLGKLIFPESGFFD
ncbi:hypothetical protein [Lysinibacillus xylanilyticus]|uniref:DUF1641 domain-containing protein n=1 Tax=Lysinibacillus xylanilyticus TaxID=582475 RepID=A0ABV3W088_9BACI